MTRGSWLAWFIAACLIVYGATNVVLTYTRLSHTFDESAHIGAGLEWWQYHRYTYEPLHPPLARVIATAPLYFNGSAEVNKNRTDDFWFHGMRALHANDHYKHNLFVSRGALLPFYLISCVMVYVWALQLFGTSSALLSLGLYVTLPHVAAHAGLVTTDMAQTATFMTSMLAMLSWLKRPTEGRAMLLGFVLGIMLATKFSSLLQFGVAFGFILSANYITKQPAFTIRREYAGHIALIIAPVALLFLGAVFFFDYGAYIKGWEALLEKNKNGHATWLFGPLYNHGVWYFFPVVYLFKTPLVFLLSNVLSTSRTIGDVVKRGANVERIFPLLATIAVFAISMPSNINIGLRHVLVVYPLLAVPAGYGLLTLWNYEKLRVRILLRATIVLLLGLQLADFTRSFPDRLSYYNQLGVAITGGHTERISADSDFEWQQGMLQLADTIKRRGIPALYGCFWYGGAATDFKVLGVPFMGCPPGPLPGWLAVSKVEKLLNPDRYKWLEGVEPADHAGNTILLYHFE